MRSEVTARCILDAMVKSIFDGASDTIIDGSFFSEIGPLVDQESLNPKSTELVVKEAYSSGRDKLLDFGCGLAAYRTMLEEIGYRWKGVNYKEGMADSAAVMASDSSEISFYDGLHLPYADSEFDVVYSFQTFEHIQDIGVTFSEIYRILKPGGRLIGQVGYLEQFHDYSTFNFTPYGLKIACQSAGLRLSRVYPKHDCFTWLLRRLLVVTSGSDETSLNANLQHDNAIGRAFVEYGRNAGLDTVRINLLRLMFCAQFVFEVAKD